MVKRSYQLSAIGHQPLAICCQLFAFVIFNLLLSPIAFSQEVTATASTDKSEYLVGDYIHYNIQINYGKGLKVYPPFLKDSLRNVTLIKEETPVQEEKTGKVTATYGYILSGYDSAAITIPPIKVLFQGPGDTTARYALTNPVSFTVRTVNVNMQEGIKDVKSPLTIPLDWRLILLLVVVALAILGIIYFLYRRYVRKKSRTQPGRKIEVLPPHAIALAALKGLEEKKLWQKGLIKEYHSEITEIIRRYFESRFDMPAMELPTSEAVELLRRRQDSEPILKTTYDFLSNADLVKFAKFTPIGSVNEEMMKQAYEIVNMTTLPSTVEQKAETSDVQ